MARHRNARAGLGNTLGPVQPTGPRPVRGPRAAWLWELRRDLLRASTRGELDRRPLEFHVERRIPGLPFRLMAGSWSDRTGIVQLLGVTNVGSMVFIAETCAACARAGIESDVRTYPASAAQRGR